MLVFTPKMFVKFVIASKPYLAFAATKAALSAAKIVNGAPSAPTANSNSGKHKPAPHNKTMQIKINNAFLIPAIKTVLSKEFSKFAETLEKTQKKVGEASDELDKLVGTRTRKIQSKLKNIASISDEEAVLLLEDDIEEKN